MSGAAAITAAAVAIDRFRFKGRDPPPPAVAAAAVAAVRLEGDGDRGVVVPIRDGVDARCAIALGILRELRENLVFRGSRPLNCLSQLCKAHRMVWSVVGWCEMGKVALQPPTSCNRIL